MIKALIFDCFGVLTVDTWHAFLDSLPVGADVQKARDLNKAFDSGFISHDDFMNGVQEITGQTPPDIETVSGSDAIKNTVLLSYIAELKRHYKIGLLSNISSDWITRELLTKAEQELFDALVFSYEVGVAKPNPRIYEIACERLGVAPAEAVMIDDIGRYIEAAQTLGMQGVVYSNFADFRAALPKLLNTNN